MTDRNTYLTLKKKKKKKIGDDDKYMTKKWNKIFLYQILYLFCNKYIKLWYRRVLVDKFIIYFLYQMINIIIYIFEVYDSCRLVKNIKKTFIKFMML
jgi:hypothetical protein